MIESSTGIPEVVFELINAFELVSIFIIVAVAMWIIAINLVEKNKRSSSK